MTVRGGCGVLILRYLADPPGTLILVKQSVSPGRCVFSDNLDAGIRHDANDGAGPAGISDRRHREMEGAVRSTQQT